MKKTIFLIPGLIVVLSLNLYLRAFNVNFPQLKQKARESVEKEITQEAVKQIYKNFSKLDDLAKDNLINKLIKEKKIGEANEIEKKIQKEYKKFKNRYQDSNGQTYLSELDCWHWAKYVENVVLFGHPGDKVVNGRQVDSLMLAPLGSSLPYNQFLFYFSGFLYKIFSFIAAVPLFTFVFYLPLFFAAVFIITLYLLCFYRWGNTCAIVTCLFIGLSPVFIARSATGWFDMDTFALFFPLLTAWTYARSHEASPINKKLLWIFFSAFWAGLFSFTWINWWFIFLIIILYEIYSIFNLFFLHLKKKQKYALLKTRLFSCFIFTFAVSIWVFLFSGPAPLKYIYKQVSAALVLNKSLAESTIWPNVYHTVEELGKTTLKSLTIMIGDKIVLGFSAICLVVVLLRIIFNRKYTGFSRDFICILMFWFFAMSFACLRGVRFCMFLIVPMGFSAGFIIKEAFEYLRLEKRKIIVVLTAVGTGVLLGNCLTNAYKTAEDTYPLIRKSSYETLAEIKEKTPKDAIINSWWDYGDWFKSISRRRVIFDGQSQNVPQAYWMGNCLLNSNEEEAVMTLRMLNNGGNRAYEIINGYFKDPLKTILFLKKILVTEPWIVKDVLNKSLPPSIAKEVISLLFNEPAKAYFVVDASMRGKMGAISYVGEWDFVKVYIAQNLRKRNKTAIVNYLTSLSIGEQEAARLYKEASLIPAGDMKSWFTRQLRISGDLVPGEQKNRIVLFNQGIVYNPEEKSVYIYSTKNKKYEVPYSVFIYENNKLEEKIFTNSDTNSSVLIIKDKERYQAVVMASKLGRSLFVRLYYLNGAGLRCFKPFLTDEDDYFRVYEIIWEKGNSEYE